MEQGLLIAFEGLDGAGLTTQAELAREHVEVYLSRDSSNGPKAHLTKEPTDGPAGGQIRMVLSERLEMDSDALALLFAADRLDHVKEEITPMIDDGMVVITDRYYLSSFAYQSENVSEDIDWLRSINKKARTPDLVIHLDVDAEECVARMNQSRYSEELYEKKERLRRVRQNYLEAAEILRDEGLDIRTVDGNADKEVVEKRVMGHIYDKIDEHRSDQE